jgi:peroxiredoxin Q/BCP
MPHSNGHMLSGNKAPDFSALSDSEQRISLSDYAGKIVVLFFYPKDDTAG